MNKIMTILCIGAIFAFGGCKRETKDEKFKRDCEQFTKKNCPMQMISGICLDSLCYDIESRTRNEHYTIESNLDENMLQDMLHGIILKELKNNIDLKPLTDEGITFRYTYHSDTTGEILFDLTFTREDYGK